MKKRNTKILTVEVDLKLYEELINLQKKDDNFNRSEVLRKVINAGFDKIYEYKL
jgi:metal-responsive CopG/Arc/MetJ family transcriptional regulator